jgi:hypothetical protein
LIYEYVLNNFEEGLLYQDYFIEGCLYCVSIVYSENEELFNIYSYNDICYKIDLRVINKKYISKIFYSEVYLFLKLKVCLVGWAIVKSFSN